MNLRARLSTTIAMRLVASTALLGSAVLVELRETGTYPVNPYFFLIGVTYALSLVYVATLRLATRYEWWADVQFGIDAALVTAFIAGLILAPIAAMVAGYAVPLPQMPASWFVVITAGFLVGFGARLGGGCTSGHGVCGMARLSKRSIAATVVFMGAAVVTVALMRHVVGG